MTDAALTPDPDQRARRNVWILVTAQAILGGQVAMLFVVAGLSGQMLAPNPCFATLPISLIVFGSMTTAPWLSRVMQNYGRKIGFFIGCFGGLAGAGLGALALYAGSFWLLVLSGYLTGIYMSAQGFYRFAATDTASADYKPKAISYVLAGGLISAIIGPQLVKVTTDAFVIPFLGTYAAAAAINLVGMWIFLFLDIPKPPAHNPADGKIRSTKELLSDPVILVAIICAMVSYALMNLVMTSTPLAVVGCGFETSNAADVVTGHVLAMFAPSFFTGHLIARFGARIIVAIGLGILALGGAVALQGVELTNFFGALILLGVGWNFGFIGATSMLAQAHSPAERGRVQGMNDALVFGAVTLASLASGGLMNCSGGDVQSGWAAVNMAMAPFLALAGGALIWLMFQPKRD